jgi:hypothetical protein
MSTTDTMAAPAADRDTTSADNIGMMKECQAIVHEMIVTAGKVHGMTLALAYAAANTPAIEVLNLIAGKTEFKDKKGKPVSQREARRRALFLISSEYEALFAKKSGEGKKDRALARFLADSASDTEAKSRIETMWLSALEAAYALVATKATGIKLSDNRRVLGCVFDETGIDMVRKVAPKIEANKPQYFNLAELKALGNGLAIHAGDRKEPKPSTSTSGVVPGNPVELIKSENEKATKTLSEMPQEQLDKVAGEVSTQEMFAQLAKVLFVHDGELDVARMLTMLKTNNRFQGVDVVIPTRTVPAGATGSGKK